MTANKTSFNSQTAAEAGKRSVEVRRQNTLLRNAYRHAFADKAEDLVKAFIGGNSEALGVKIPLEMRARIAEQVITQTVITAMTTAIKQSSDIDMLLAKVDAKALETLPPESDSGDLMTTTDLMKREGTQTEAASAIEIEKDYEIPGLVEREAVKTEPEEVEIEEQIPVSVKEEDEEQIFGEWYNELSEQEQIDIKSEYFHDSLDEMLNYYTIPKDEMIKRFKIKIGV